jgi:hypothetical protein
MYRIYCLHPYLLTEVHKKLEKKTISSTLIIQTKANKKTWNHYYNSWFFKRFKLTNLSFCLMDTYILTKGQGLEWHMYLLTDQFDYSGSFD